METIPYIIRGELVAANAFQPVQQIETGLSGAKIWKCIDDQLRVACLRAWPIHHPSQQRLAEIHQYLQYLTNAGVSFTPTLYCSSSGNTIASDGRRLWELTSWLPGDANYLQAPSWQRLTAAMEGLAKIHHVWSRCWSCEPVCVSPTVKDRVQRLSEWESKLGEASSIAGKARNAIEKLLILDTLELLRARCSTIQRELRLLADQPVTLHFVIRDIWSDHVLFTGDKVTGVIDFGAARIDEPATDLVRLLGTLEPTSQAKTRKGLDDYHRYRRELAVEGEDIVEISWERYIALDRAATLLSAAQWMQWIVIERRDFSQSLDSLLHRWRQFVLKLQAE